MFIPMTDNGVNTVYFQNFIRFGLGITTGDDNTCLWIGSYGLPNGLSGLHGGFLSDRACIDNAQVCLMFTRRRHTARIFQLLGDGIRLVLIDFAAQSGDSKFEGVVKFHMFCMGAIQPPPSTSSSLIKYRTLSGGNRRLGFFKSDNRRFSVNRGTAWMRRPCGGTEHAV